MTHGIDIFMSLVKPGPNIRRLRIELANFRHQKCIKIEIRFGIGINLCSIAGTQNHRLMNLRALPHRAQQLLLSGNPECQRFPLLERGFMKTNAAANQSHYIIYPVLRRCTQ